MMKVISEGKDMIGWSKEYECTGKGNENCGCSAKLLVEERDLWHTVGYSWGERDDYYTFICPLCGCMTDISEYDISFKVRSDVNKRCEGIENGKFVRNEAEKIKTKRLEIRKRSD